MSAVDTRRVHIRLLGPIEASSDGTPLGLRGPKRLGLLAILATRDQAVPVATIAEEIWPGQPSQQATRSIRTYLSQFRREAGIDFLRADHAGSGYRLDLDRTSVDTHRFRQAIRDAGRADISPAECQIRARDALDLWRGPALLEVQDQPWAAGEVHALDELRRTAQQLLVRARLALGDHHALCSELEMFVTEHPFDESFWADLMLAQYRSGRQTDALRTFQRARSTLVEELSLEPGPELTQLEAAIFRHDPALDLEPAVRGHSASTARPVSVIPAKSDLDWLPTSAFKLVGRMDSVGTLAASLDVDRPEGLTVIEAEPGEGKTRMLTAVPDLCGDDDLIVWGRAVDPTRPFGLWLRMVRFLLPHSTIGDPVLLDQLDHLVGGRGTERLTGSAARPDAAIVALMQTAAAGRRVVVVLDDLHDADPASIAFLEHLVMDRPLDLHIAAATRPISTSANAALATMMGRVAEAARLRRIDLRPLSRSAVTELAAAQGLDPETIEALWAATAGNALLVTESLLDTRRRQDPRLGVPRTVRERTMARLAGYTDDARQLAEVASLLGDPFDAMLAGEAAALAPNDASEATNELTADFLVGPVDGDPGLFEFTHPLLRETVRSLVPAGSLPVRHRAIAEALERRRERGVPVDAATLGHHWASAGRAGDLGLAVTRLSEAAVEARRRFGYDIAGDHLRRAIDLLSRQGGDAETRARLHLDLAATENAAGDVNAAKEACVEAADAARTTDRSDLLADAALLYGGDLPMAEDVADERVLDLLAEADARAIDPARRARVRSRLAQVEYWLAPRATRVAWCEDALGLAASDGDPHLQAVVGIASFWALNAPDEANRRLQIVNDLDEAVTRLGDLEVLLAAGKCRLHLMLEFGEFDRAVDLARRHARLADRLGYSEHRRLALNFAATVQGLEENYDEAMRLSEEALALQTSHGKWFQARVAHEWQVLPWRRTNGDLALSERWWSRVAEADPERPAWRALCMWIAAEQGDLDKAIGELDRLDIERFVAAEPRLDYFSIVCAAADTVALTGDRHLARVISDALAPYEARNAMMGQTLYWGSVSHHLGRMAAVLGDVDAARDHLEDALLRHERMHARDLTRRTEAALAALEANAPAD